MTAFAVNSRVAVRPFDRRLDADGAVIGDQKREIYLAIPGEGLELLDDLAAGLTVAEASARYEERHGETADVLGFVEAMREHGFVADPSDDAVATPTERVRHHHYFTWLSPERARLFVGRPVLAVLGAVMLVGLALVISQPSLVPGPLSLVYHDHFVALTWTTVFFTLLGVVIHECGHVVAARAVGVPARLTAGNQMYVLVAQTDMSGMWLVPRRSRYLAFVFGTVLDTVTASLLIGLRWLDAHDIVTMPNWLAALVAGVLVTYYTRIVWQLFFFLRTDGYYVISTAMRCRNLLGDTEDYLWNLGAKVRRSRKTVDQSHVPARELRIVRWYSLIWVLGRVFSLSAFVTLGVPVLWAYVSQVGLLIAGQPTRFSSWDFATIFVISLLFDFSGLALWIRKLIVGARRRAGLPERGVSEDATARPLVPAQPV